MEHTELGMVLRTVNYRETDKILTLLTRENGKMSVMAGGCRKMGSPLASSSEMFCCAEYELYTKGGRSYVKGAALKQNFFSIRKDMRALMTATLIAETLEKVSMPGDANPRIFALAANALNALNEGMDAAGVFVFFVFKLHDHMGLRPELSHCVKCGNVHTVALSAAYGGALCADCAGGRRSPASHIETVGEILRTPAKRIFPANRDALLVSAKEWLMGLLDAEPNSLKLFDSMVG